MLAVCMTRARVSPSYCAMLRAVGVDEVDEECVDEGRGREGRVVILRERAMLFAGSSAMYSVYGVLGFLHLPAWEISVSWAPAFRRD